eukprot:3574367-Alexandrium_andersonii.AAC.1
MCACAHARSARAHVGGWMGGCTCVREKRIVWPKWSSGLDGGEAPRVLATDGARRQQPGPVDDAGLPARGMRRRRHTCDRE